MPENQDALLLKQRARRRLVGAIALVLLAVIVLPLVLDREPRPVNQELSVQIPSQDSGRFNTKVLPPPPAPPQGKAAPSDAKAPSGAAEKSEAGSAEPPAAREQRAAPEKAAPVEPDAAEARRARAALNDEGYIVPLGLFADPKNAKQVLEKAAAAGIKTYTERIKAAKGEQTRVRAGPFESREAAEKARDALKSAGLQAGRVAQR